MANYFLVDDLTIWQPGFDFPHSAWTLGHYSVDSIQGKGNVMLTYISGASVTSTENCDGVTVQTVDHIVNSCSVTKLRGSLLVCMAQR